MAWYRLIVETNCVGCERQMDFEVPDDELAECGSDQEREDHIASYANDALGNLVTWGWCEIEASEARP